jgi:molecular chaperone GrpE
METLEGVYETALTNTGSYEVIEDCEVTDSAIEQLKQELDTERERGLRLLAEFDNYRRRTRQERAVAEQEGKREVLLAFLEVMDDFDRALLHVGETSDSVATGLKLMHQRFTDLLHSNGVRSFESEGKPFDPTVHEAMTMVDGEGEDSGTVYAEYQRGYLINGELLRPARVAVLK